MESLEQRLTALEKTCEDLSRRLTKIEEPAILKHCRVETARNGLGQGGSVRITHPKTGLHVEGQTTGNLKDLVWELAGNLQRQVSSRDSNGN